MRKDYTNKEGRSVQCEYCGRALSPDDWQCPGCGAPVEQRKGEKEQEVKTEETQAQSQVHTKSRSGVQNESVREDKSARDVNLGSLLDRSDYGGFCRRCVAESLDIVFVALFSGITGCAGIAVLLFGIYHVVGESYICNGATLGKRIMGIRVVDVYYKPLTLKKSFARNICKFLSLISMYIGFIMIIFTKKRQSLHDRLCETYVIRRKVK